MNKKYLIIFPIALAILEAGTYLGNDAYLPALPNLMHDMHINQQFAQYTLISWFLGSASIQLFIGPLADFYGRRPIVLWGAAIFILTSLICAYTDQYWLLLVARFFQGTAVCTTIVGGYATVHEAFDSHKSVRVIALMGAITILAPAIGPLFGALIVHYLHDWRFIFYALAIWGALTTTTLWVTIPETLKQQHPLNIRQNLTNYFEILKNPIWLRHTLTACSLILGLFTWVLTSPFLLINHYHLSTLNFGLSQACVFVGLILGLQISGQLLKRKPVNLIIKYGMLFTLLTAILLLGLSTLIDLNAQTLTLFMSLIALGTGITNAPTPRLAIESSSAPTGQKVAMYSLCFSLMGVLIATMTTFMSTETPSMIIATTTTGFIFAGLLIRKNYAHIHLKTAD